MFTIIELKVLLKYEKSYNNIINNLDDNHNIFVYVLDNKIVGMITLLHEQKLIHNMGRVGHIEDVVVSSSCRGHGLGKMLVNRCIEYAKKQGCYKCILDCSEENVPFYKKCNSGFEVKGVQMALYY